MAQRISGLMEVDPLSVPLPHGTEVTTRVTELFEKREEAHRVSVLPDDPPNVGDLEAWLVALRRARLP